MISILGAGAIGQLVAHKLTDALVDCQFIVRDPEKYEPSWQIVDDNVISRVISVSDITDELSIELLAITVKAPQLAQALESVKHRLTATSQVILFQNGMGHEKVASQYVPPENIYFASNTHGAYRQSLQHLIYAGEGQLSIGPLMPISKVPGWFEDFEQADFSAVWHRDIEPILLKKLFINACINPLTAIYQCKNGELLEGNKKTRLLSLIEENQRFAKQLNVEFATSLKEMILTVIEKTAENYNSMYQDVTKGIETEINAINGYLLDLMSQHKFKAIHNWQLWSDFHISFPPKQAFAKERAKSFESLQYQVTQQAGTERPFTGRFNQHSETGNYICVCCDSVLFDQNGKFDSHCGWPSFDRSTNNKAIAYRDDLSHGMSRTEILCAQCGSHLGHVFDDGPTETGVRFCVNSASLDFTPKD